jgi:hypothetical protein
MNYLLKQSGVVWNLKLRILTYLMNFFDTNPSHSVTVSERIYLLILIVGAFGKLYEICLSSYELAETTLRS